MLLGAAPICRGGSGKEASWYALAPTISTLYYYL